MALFSRKKIKLPGITSKINGDYYCINCLHSFRPENKFKSHESHVCKNHDYCYLEMIGKSHESHVCKNHDYCCLEILGKGNKILKYNHGKKSMKVPFAIYADTVFT